MMSIGSQGRLVLSGALLGAAIAAVAVFAPAVVDTDGRSASNEIAAAGKGDLLAPVQASVGRAAVKSPLLSQFEWFGETDQSRLPGRHLGTFVDRIETEDGIVLILDTGADTIVTTDPGRRVTEIAAGVGGSPFLTPRQAVADNDGALEYFIAPAPQVAVADQDDIVAK